MSYRHHTAADLGITGPHLVCRTIDGDENVVLEVLGYDTEWANVSTGDRHDVVRYRYRFGPHEGAGLATRSRFEVRVA